MTGDATIDSVVLIIAVLAGALGNAFGWPWLVKLADLIKQRDEAAKPTQPDDVATLKGGAVSPWLLALLPLLKPLIDAIVEALRKRLGREPTEEEVRDAASALFVKPAADLPDSDLEHHVGGASKVNGIVSHAHSTMDHANRSMTEIDAAVAEVRGLLRR